ncbi:enolase C-terminal domain-like protein [Enterovibrio coralii]|uniref:Dipeptide epimerase n=1 Tax=Enterovibrio coralii TaxID=294935 RepID=A0A135ICC0_9GAMM|nr:enolase C-terminal domain-like protein [Enterovibrio coralii]KXF83112.1 dipeptide epimerase [Enterovibrio coralii]
MKLTRQVVQYALKRPFRISRGSRTTAEVIQVTIEKDGKVGIGECSPTGRYGESFDSVIAQIDSLAGKDFGRESLQYLLPPGAARNAVDCALWDLASDDFPFDLPLPETIQTAMTVSIADAETMAEEAARYVEQGATLIKVKLDADDVFNRLSAVRKVAPNVTLIVDANEAWSTLDLQETIDSLVPLNITMIEQPLPASEDDKLTGFKSPIPLCADESCHTKEDIPLLATRYQIVNIKLDKTGGLTAALELEQAARDAGLEIMVGCMLGSSIAMKAALPVAAKAILVDLDGAFLIKDDVPNGLNYQTGSIVLA